MQSHKKKRDYMTGTCKECGAICCKASTWCMKCTPKFNKITPEGRRKLSKSKLGKNNPNYGKRKSEVANWKGGRIYRLGYILIKTDNHPNSNSTGYVQEHRLIMEKYIGRYLSKKEKVHHINGVKDDNRIENLQLFSNIGKHIKTHVSNYHRDKKGKFINGNNKNKN